MKPLAFLVLTLCVFSDARGEEATAAPEEVLDSPGGRIVAILLPGAARTTLDTREGYARVRVEGWIRLPGFASAPPAPAPEPLLPPAPEEPDCALCGSVAALLSSGETQYGAGARVTVLGPAANLEKAWTALKDGYEREMADLDARIRNLEEQKKTALSSSENLGEATRSLDRARSSQKKAEKERGEIRDRYAASADDLFRSHRVAEVAADAVGHYSFSALPPGKYYLLAILTTAEGVRRWYLPVEVGPRGGARNDLRSEVTGPDPYFGAK